MRELNKGELEDVSGGMTMALLSLFAAGVAIGIMLSNKDGACRVDTAN